ncbi:MAG: NarK/NasA family nitrate transporter [Nitrospira sp.]|nr:NarK/NasA family nitrate transporter [Nitrospira sp.]
MLKRVLGALRSGHWPSLVGAWLHFEVSFMVWLLIGALGVSIAEEFGLSATQKGLLVAVPLLGGALLRVAVGILSDCVGPKPIGLVILGGELLAVVWGWLGASTYPQMLGVGLLLGIAGGSFAVALPIAGRAYPPAHQGLALGVAASANSGTVLAVFFAPRLAQTVGWHGVFGLAAVPILLTTLLFAWLVRGGGALRQEGGYRWRQTVAAIFRRPSMYWLCFVYAITFGGFVGFVSYLPIFYHDQYGLNLVTAGSVTALCGLSGSLARPLGGYLADRLGGLKVLLVLFPVIAGFALGLGQLPGLIWSILLMTLAVAIMGFGNGVVFQVVSDRFPKQIGLASGLIGAAGGFGGFLLPSWMGLLKDATGTYQSGFLLFAALSMAAAVSVAVVLQRQRQAQGRLGGDGGLD